MNQCSFCNLEKSDNNELIAGDDVYICSECILAGYKILYGDMEPREVEMSVDKDDYFIEAKNVVDSMFKEIKQVKVLNNSKQANANTSFKVLNGKLNGFKSGELVFLASRPGMGKTSLALNMALNAMEKGEGVAYFSLEMSSESLMKRMLSSKTSISLRNLRFGNLNKNQWDYLFDTTGKISKENFFVDDSGFLSLSILCKELSYLKKEHPEIKLAFIDYWQLVDYKITSGSIVKSLKQLAEKLQITIIVLDQLRPSLEYRDNKRPRLDDIKESIQESVDTIVFIYRDEIHQKRIERSKEIDDKKYQSNFQEKPEDEAEIIIAKSYNGETGTVKHLFQKEFLRFVDIDHRSKKS